jgi:hypothetical protein
MNRLLATFTLALILSGAAIIAAPSAVAQKAAGFTTLFDGKSLDGWNKVGDANWHLVKSADGDYVEADKGTGFLVTPKTYGNFTLRVEFWADAPSNSGVFIRIADPQKIGADSAYEINIYDRREDQTYRTGAIVNVAAPVKKVDSGDGKWHTYEITADGDHLSAKWDGVLSAEGHDAKHTSGNIGLQYSAGVVRFRKVEISTK